MSYKKLLIYCNIFILTLTISFSNIYSNFSYGEPTSTTLSNNGAEASTETTTEAPSIINNFCEPSKNLDIKGRAAILTDADSGIVLYEKNADEVLYPASITKILTTLIACEEGDFNSKVTHSENAINGIGYGSSTMGMKIGETISFEDALYGIMMCSANETCMAVAELISGSVPAFVDKMNKKAAELGCTNSHFANPHGFHDPNHYTTARDMSKIALAAVKNEKFSSIWGTMIRTLPATNLVNEPRGLVNKAKILDDESRYYYPYIKGAKTGFHDEAKNTLVSCAEKNGIKLIAVVMKDNGQPLAYEDSKLLYEYGFSQYEEKALYTGGSYNGEVTVVQEYKNKEYYVGSVKTEVKGELKAKVPKFMDSSGITAVPVANEKCMAPVNTGDVLGKMKVMYKDYALGEINITAAESFEKLSNGKMAIKELKANIKYYASKIISHWKIPALAVVGIVVLIIFIKIIRSIFRPKRKKKRRKKKKYTTDSYSRKDMQLRKAPSSTKRKPIKKKRPSDNNKPIKKKRPSSDKNKPIKKKRPVKPADDFKQY